MHLFSVLALLLLSRHLEVIYGCGMDLEKKHNCRDECVTRLAIGKELR